MSTMDDRYLTSDGETDTMAAEGWWSTKLGLTGWVPLALPVLASMQHWQSQCHPTNHKKSCNFVATIIVGKRQERQ